ncbi:ABC transporter substrate-binding protein [Paenibacillus allorhizosphaerae]|uniref:Extracellular solute-binding protein n=1 Tax=Paenibacillus allorhizosphaerae TaxID=2849866 RepID=A0ABM8VBB7_9BACL|nr:extracellular solute-binding protein [Paenibacillus allorhizosphaerae]CAG7617053.1 hypothetical protein PAECIP111802_00359 [Paenibacillus allorhizosphaerae]
MVKKPILIALSVSCSLMFLSACGGTAPTSSGTDSKDKSTGKPEEAKPITLQAYAYSGALVKEDFDKYIAAPLKQKYPHITLEYVASGKGTSPNELATAGTMPDIIMTGMRQLLVFQELDVPADLTGLMKTNRLDRSLYRKEAIDAIADYGSKGELYALPLYVNFYAMLYNKDIFDRFSVEYPKDQMTWDEVKSLAAKVSKVQDGITYKGLQPADIIDVFAGGLSLSYMDEQNKKAKVTTDGWKKVFEIAKEINSIPGNEPKDPKNIWKGSDDFFKDKNIAMMPYFGTRVQKAAQLNDELGFNWDVVSFPSFKDSPGKSSEVDAQVLALSKTSKHPDEAFKVIQYLTSSEEVQGNLAKMGRALPALNNENLMKSFGADYPLLKTKNINGIFKTTPRQPHKASQYDDIVRKWLKNSFLDHLSGKYDVNTALKTAEEGAAKEIESMKK